MLTFSDVDVVILNFGFKQVWKILRNFRLQFTVEVFSFCFGAIEYRFFAICWYTFARCTKFGKIDQGCTVL